MVTKNKKKKTKTADLVDEITQILFLIVLFFAPFYRGLYFEDDLNVFHIILGVIFLLYFSNRVFKNKESIVGKTDLTMLGFVLLYVLLLPFAVSFRGNLIAIVRYGALFLIFLYVREMAKEEKEKTLLNLTLISSGLLTVFVSVVSFVGAIEIQGILNLGNRMSGVLQYPNAYAVYLGVLLLIAIEKPENKLMKMLYRFSCFMFTVGIMLTFSRIVWAVLLCVYVLGLVMIPVKQKLSYLVEISIYSMMALICSGILFKFSGNPTYQLLVIGAMGGVNIVLYHLWDKMYDRIALSLSERKVLMYVLGSLFLLLIVVLSMSSGVVIERIKSISFEDESWLGRMMFYKSALKMASDSNWLGLGAGSFEALYKNYRIYIFETKAVHSVFFSVLVEGGILGVALYFLFVINILLKQLFKRDQLNYFLACTVLFLHSLLDFDMSVPFIALMMFILLALVDSTGLKEQDLKTKKFSRYKNIGLVVLSLVIVIQSSFWAIALSHANKGFDYAQAKVLDQTIVEFEKAYLKDSYNTTYIRDITTLYFEMYKENQQVAFLNASKGMFAEFKKWSPENAETHQFISDYYLKNGDVLKALEHMDKAVELDSQNLDIYEVQLSLYKRVFDEIEKQGLDKTVVLDYVNTESNIAYVLDSYNAERNFKRFPQLEEQYENHVDDRNLFADNLE